MPKNKSCQRSRASKGGWFSLCGNVHFQNVQLSSPGHKELLVARGLRSPPATLQLFCITLQALLTLPPMQFWHLLAFLTCIKINPNGNCTQPPRGFPWSRSNYLSLIALIGRLTALAVQPTPPCCLYPLHCPSLSGGIGFKHGLMVRETTLTSCPQFARAT